MAYGIIPRLKIANRGDGPMARTWGRRLARIAGYGILVLSVLAAVALTFTVGWRPVIGAKKRALTSRKFEVTPARMQRGDYLVHAVMHCMGCLLYTSRCV